MRYSVAIHKEDDYITNFDYLGASWAYINVSAILGKTEKATVTLVKLLMNKIDLVVTSDYAKRHSVF